MKRKITALFVAIYIFVLFQTFSEPVMNTENEEDFKVSYLTGISSIITPSLLIGSWNRWVSKSSWAQVTWDDASHFYEHSWVWDTDWYWTNFVLHPYQGSLYYMGARNSNFNALGSTAIAFLGSGIWEYFFETNAPSKNDMIYTTLGGFAIGEMLYRLSIEGSNIWKPLGYILNPMRLYSDFTTGHKPVGTFGNIQELSFRTYVNAAYGFTTPQKDYHKIDETYPGFFGIELNVEYGDTYTHDSNSPYSQFELEFGGGVGSPSGEGFKEAEKKIGYNIHLFSNGMLWARELDTGNNTDTSIGFILDYDCIWQNFFNFTALAPGFAVKHRVNFENSRMEFQLHTDGILLGTTDFFYFRRNYVKPDVFYCPYNYTIGAELVGKWKWLFEKGSIIDFTLHSYAMYDFYNQLQQKASIGWEFINYATLTYELPVSRKVYLGLENTLYMKKSLYKYYPNVFSFMYGAGFYTKIRFTN